MVPHPAVRVKKWQEHCPGSTVVKYNHPSGRISYIYVSATGETVNSPKECLQYMMNMLNTFNAPTTVEKGPSLATILSTAKREYRARVWKEKGGKVFNNTYKRDNVPNGQLCVVYESPEGRKFRSWKQCVKYMGDDPLASVSWKDLSSNGEETHPLTADADCNFQSADVQALPWKLVGSRSTDPSSPGEKGSLNGDRFTVQKAQTLNVISSSSSSEGSHGRKSSPAPPTSRQAVISISTSKELDNENDGSSSSSSSSSGKSISPANSSSCSSAYGNSPLSSSSSKEPDHVDREDGEMHIANGLVHLHSRPSQDSVEKPQTELGPPAILAVREEDHTSGVEAMTAHKSVLPLNTGLMESDKAAANRRPSPELPPKSAARAVILGPHIQAEAAFSAGEAVSGGKSLGQEAGNISTPAVAAMELPPNEKAALSSKRKIHGEVGGEEDEETERPTTKTQNTCEDVGEEPLASVETIPSAAKGADERSQRESQEDDVSEGESGSLKELMWKMVQEATKKRKRKPVGSSPPKKTSSTHESKRSKTRDSHCSCHGATIIVVCPCRIRHSHK